jgi:hypothetical protein
MSKLTSCIMQQSLQAQERIPKEVKIWASKEKMKEASEALEIHIQKLETIKKSVQDQYADKQDAYKTQPVENSLAASYVNRAETDPTNELNTFKVKPTFWQNQVQRFRSMTAAIAHIFSRDVVTDGEKAVLNHFMEKGGFGAKMNVAIRDIFKMKGMEAAGKASSFKYRYMDMLQYLPGHPATFNKKADRDAATEKLQKEGYLDSATRNAIAATVYEWVATDGRRSISQTEQSLGRLLSLEKDESLPRNAFELLEDAGTHAETVAKQMGRTILQRMSIAAGPKSDSLAQARMELSLGYLALAAMEEIGLIERQSIIADHTIDAKAGMNKKQLAANPIGIEALKNGHNLTKEKLFYKKDGSRPDPKGLLLIKTIRVIDTKTLKGIESVFMDGRQAFDKLFANEPQEFGVRWVAKKVKSFRIGRSNVNSNTEQTNNLNNYNSIPYQRNDGAIGFLKSMWNLIDSQKSDEEKDAMTSVFQEMFGAPAADNLLDLHKKSNEGIRRGITQDFQDILDFEIERERTGNNEFYPASDFMVQMRMIMRGEINPQNKKMHRATFAPTGFQTTFKKDPKGKLDQAFLEAVAVAFDLETGKGLLGDADAQVAALMDILSNPENKKYEAVSKAITAIQKYNVNGEMTGAMLQDIANGSSAIDNKVTGLKGLFEYARYASVKSGEEFTTDMHAEIDGVSNGIIIGIIQLLPDSADKRTVLAMAAMGGVSTSAFKESLNKLLIKNNLHDAYQRMAKEWALNIANFKHDWAVSKDKQEQVLFKQAMALGGILGEFQDKEGVINNIIRKLSKPRTMQIVFGAATKGQIKLFMSESVLHDGIYKKVEKIIERVRKVDKANPDPLLRGDFTKLMADVALLTGNKSFTLEKYFAVNSKAIILKNLQAFKLEQTDINALTEAVEATYGKAMEGAIDTIYGALIEARKPLNAVVQLAVTTYNTILKKLVDIKIQQQTDDLVVMKARVDELSKQLYDPTFTGDKEDISSRLAQYKEDMQFKEDPTVITKEDLADILKSIEHLIPKIKTPIHKAGKGNESYLPLATVGKNRAYNKQAEVEQEYNGKLSKYVGHAEGIPYLENSGVAPVITAIHMMDSMVANGLMKQNTHFLNNHDGFSHGIGDSQIIADAANTIFGQIMTDYSIAQAFADMHEELAAKSNEMMKALEVTSDELLYGTKIDPKSGLMTGGLINDNVITYELLKTAQIVTDKQRKEFIGEDFLGGAEYKKALEEFMTFVTESLGDSDVDQILAALTKNINSMAEQTARNKKEITDAVTHWGNYPYHGLGVDVTPTNTSGKVFGDIDTNTVLFNDETINEVDRLTLKERMEQGHGSSDTDVSINKDDYDPVQIIDRKNVLEVLDAIVDVDKGSPHISVQDSPSHLSHLKKILSSLVAPVMTQVELFMGEHKINNETQGMWSVSADGSKKIWIQTQQRSTLPPSGMLSHGIRMSTAEVYVHELVHHITTSGLKNYPHLQRQAEALRELAYSEFSKMYGQEAYRVFMSDPNADLTDPANEYEIKAAKARWKYVFNSKRNPDGSNNGVPEFISHGITNENFKRELAKLTVSQEIIDARKSLRTVFGRNMQETVVNIFTLVTNFIYERFNKQRHSDKVDQELENLVRAISYTESKNKTMLARAAIALEGTLTAIGLTMDEKIVGRAKKIINSTAVGKAVEAIKEFPELNNMLSYQMRIALHWYHSQQQGLIPAVWSEMQGVTERVKPLHDMIRMAKYVRDHAKNEAAATIRKDLKALFKEPLDTFTKSAITKVLLKTDVSYLVGKGLSSQVITGYVSDSSKREARIKEILKQINQDPNLQPYAHFFENAADDLGYFMINSVPKNSVDVPLMNAHNIVAIAERTYDAEHQIKSYPNAVDLVEQLATLYSLRYVKGSDRNAAVKVMTENWSAMEDILNRHNALKDRAFKDTFYGNPYEMTKGYTKQILNSRIQFEMAHVADPTNPNDPTRKMYEDAGYYMQISPLKRDPKDPVQSDIYLFKSTLGTVNDLQPGIASFTQNIGRGAVAYDIQGQLGNTIDPAQEADKNNQIVLASVEDKIKAMFNPRSAMDKDKYKHSNNPENYMVPKFNHVGKMTEMRYMMNEHTKDTVLEQFSEFDAVLAAMTSQIIDKVVAPKINQDLILELKRMADDKAFGLKAQRAAYVEISPWSPEKRYRDIYHQLPPKARQNIKSEWGEDRMWVAQDVVDLAFGQRKYSPSETFGKTKQERNLFEKILVETLKLALGTTNFFNDTPAGSIENTSVQGRAVRRATAVYSTMAQLTKMGKSNIVVRNLPVIVNNHSSNMMYLKSRGITLDEIFRLNKEAALDILQYQKDKSELDSWINKRELIARKHSVPQAERNVQITNINRKIATLENQLALNKVTELVKAGAVPGVVDDVEMGHTQSPHTYGVDKFLDDTLSVLPDKLQRAGKALFMTTDTEGFKMMNNAVKLTDFTGRYVLYHHLTGKKGMSKDQAISEVMDNFINFDLPTHRMIGMLNEIGLVMFSKYQFRVLKQIKNVSLEHPFSTLATYIIGKAMGDNNIINSIPLVTKDVFQSLANPFFTAAGSLSDIVTVDGVQLAGGVMADAITPN